MANYRKSFNFRSGVQVDNDRLIVDSRGNVGIGTSIPRKELDIYGTTKVNGLLESNSVQVSGISTFSGSVSVGSAITFGASSGIISATSFRGDGSLLSGIVAIATGGWISNAGTLSTSQLIGIGTLSPVHQLQVGGNPLTSGGVAISSEGNILVNGISTFSSLGVTGLSTTRDHRVTGVSTIASLVVSGLATIRDFQITGVSTIATLGVTGLTTTRDHRVTGVSTVATLGVTGLTTTRDLQVTGISTIATLGVTGLTTTRELQVTGVSTLGIVTSHNIFSAGVITATSFVGPLAGIASLAQNLSGAPNINVGVLTATTANANTLFVSGNTLSALSNGNVGVGTTNPTSDLQIRKELDSRLEVLSNTGTATIGIGSSASGGNNSAEIVYNPISQVLNIDNNGSGPINVNLHQGSGGVVGASTGGFFVKYGPSGNVVINASYDGRFAINQSVLSAESYKLVVNGNAKIKGSLDLDQGINASSGIATINSLNLLTASTFPANQNFNTNAGLSTFNDLRTIGYLSVGTTASFASASTFSGSVTLGDNNFSTSSPLNVYGLSQFYRDVGITSSTFVIRGTGNGIATAYLDPRDQVVLGSYIGAGKTVGAFGYGDVQIKTPTMSFIGQDLIIAPGLAVSTTGSWIGLTPAENIGMGLEFDNARTNKYLVKVGINTFFARSIFDVGAASTTMNSYFIPPALTQSELDIVRQLWNPAVSSSLTGHATAYLTTPYGVPPGSIVFNKTTNELQVGIGSTTFVGLATVGSVISVGSATYSTTAGIATYAVRAGIATYAVTAGIATYAPVAGLSTYAVRAGIATLAGNAGFATVAGIATYAPVAGLSTYAVTAGLSTYSPTAGVSTSVSGGTGSLTRLNVTGVTTSQGGFTSGIGVTNPVQITVSGNVLTFTVTGVGSTTLTLF